MLRYLLRLLLNKLVDTGKDFGRHRRVRRRPDHPRAILSQINVPQERRGGAALLRNHARIHFTATELADFGELILVVLAIEDAQRVEQSV